MGTPVDPLLHMPFALGDLRRWAAPPGTPPAARASSFQRRLFVDDDGGVDHRAHPVRALPFGQIPVHGEWAPAPIFQQPRVASTQVLRIRDRRCDKGTRLSASGRPGPRPHWLAHASSSSKVSACSGAVERDVGLRPCSSRRCSASSASRAPNGIPSSSGLERLRRQGLGAHEAPLLLIAAVPRKREGVPPTCGGVPHCIVAAAHADTGSLNSVSR